jgi:membrane-bound lytic murein transglycosylase B
MGVNERYFNKSLDEMMWMEEEQSKNNCNIRNNQIIEIPKQKRFDNFKKGFYKGLIEIGVTAIVLAFLFQGCTLDMTRRTLEAKEREQRIAEYNTNALKEEYITTKKLLDEYDKTARSSVQSAQKTTSKQTLMQQINSEIKKSSAKYNVAKALVKGVIKQESDFNPNAKSKVGAMGLMQLMPDTAKSLGVTNPFDIAQNIDGGTKHLSYLLKSYDGNVELALGAYNAGSNRITQYGDVPPFKETQQYVKKVMGYYKQYALEKW